GVKGGIIKEIAFEGVENVRVVMTIEEKSREYIRRNAIATLGTDGLIGNTIISLIGGTAAVPAIENGDILQSGPGGGMNQMMDLVKDNGEHLSIMTKNFAALSQSLVEGKGTIGALLMDEEMANSLKKNSESLNAILADAGKAVDNMVILSERLNSNQGLMHDLTTDTTLFASLRESAAQLQGVAQTANALVSNLNETTARLNNENNVVNLMTNDPETANEIKQILENLNQGTKKLDENMEALQSNFLFRGFFKKRAKEEAKAAAEENQ
ncbi:MAG TPA: MCE family protein, partial [Sphingobacterium sp.]|nr:MCE family protein [Sphingobacterium sp.]